MKAFMCVMLVFLGGALASGQSEVFIDANATLEIQDNADVCADFKTVNGVLFGNGTWCGSLVPVELLRFSATLAGSSVRLAWTTATEHDNYGFDVERRQGSGPAWETIAFVPGHGTSNVPQQYSCLDPIGQFMEEEVLRYRLRQIDRDGRFTYSPVVELRLHHLPSSPELYAIFPNPAGETMTVQFSLPEAGFVEFLVHAVTGREITHLPLEGYAERGFHSVSLSTSALPTGFLFIELRTASVQRFMPLLIRR